MICCEMAERSAQEKRACLFSHEKEHRGRTVDLLFDPVPVLAADSGLAVVLKG
jgi:hypothetical protein